MGSDKITVEEYNKACDRAEKAEAEVARLHIALAEAEAKQEEYREKGETLCCQLGNALLLLKAVRSTCAMGRECLLCGGAFLGPHTEWCPILQEAVKEAK